MRLGDIRVIRAFRLRHDGLTAMSEYLDKCHKLKAMPGMVLLDAYRADAYGGTGSTLDWTMAAAYRQLGLAPPLVLAGGLVAANVAQAIAAVRPSAVDTASGVEASPGRKDPVRTADFITAAKAAFAALGHA